jgi:hypothetical protein
MRILKPVSEKSTDAQICTAINTAGERRLPWRKNDFPDVEGEKSWVIPNDIGMSGRYNRGLLSRLFSMSDIGLLELRRSVGGRRHSSGALMAVDDICHEGNPRFRVKKKN